MPTFLRLSPVYCNPIISSYLISMGKEEMLSAYVFYQRSIEDVVVTDIIQGKEEVIQLVELDILETLDWGYVVKEIKGIRTPNGDLWIKRSDLITLRSLGKIH